MPLSLQIAFRFSRGKRGSLVSLISLISTVCVALGVAVLIIGFSAMNGFKRELNNRILAVLPHGEIETINHPFTNWTEVLKRIKQVPGVLAAAPYLNFTGLLAHHDKFQAIYVKSLDPLLELQFSTLSRYVKSDTWSRFQAGHQQIILGKGVADMLKIKSGDWLTMLIPNSISDIKLLQPKYIRMQVSGILTLNSQLDHSLAIIPLADAQKYLHRGKEISCIAIKVSDIFNANKLVRNAGKVTNAYVKIRSWITTYGYIYRDIQMIRTIIYLTMILVIGIACFNISCTLIIAVKDKESDIAILRTLGTKDNLIYATFIWYGLLIGLTGSIIGLIIGVLTSLNLTSIIKWLEYLLNCKLLPGNVYFIDFLPTELRWMDVVGVLSTALLLSILASWYPSQNANRIDPARILSSK